MLRSVVLAGLFLALAPNTAVAQDAGGAEAAPKAPEKKICRRSTATGSVMAKVTCHTKAEWDAISARSQSDLERQINQERARNNVQNSR